MIAKRFEDSTTSIRAVAIWLILATTVTAAEIRVATFNVSLNRRNAGDLTADLRQQDPQAAKVATVLRLVRPDVVLLNEFDFDPAGESLELFKTQYLQSADLPGDTRPLMLPHSWSAPVNTGVQSGKDLDGNGRIGGPADSFGFGYFPGQYGMVVLSRFPIDVDHVRTFQNLLWHQMPEARRPVNPETQQSWHSDSVWQLLRLSSKSHWDVPVTINGSVIHLLASHPTPPAFDGPEDRNGCRNTDEIRIWTDYLTPEHASWIEDDAGTTGGLPIDQHFCIVGDLNSDPTDGGSQHAAIQALLQHDRVNGEFVPTSRGAAEASEQQKGRNRQHQGSAEHDTADFSDNSVGNLRVDYVLPSKSLTVVDGGVFWPSTDAPTADLSECSDHHLVWLNIAAP